MSIDFTPEQLQIRDSAERLCARFGDVVTNIEFSIAANSAAEQTRLAALARQVQSHDERTVRALITGSPT